MAAAVIVGIVAFAAIAVFCAHLVSTELGEWKWGCLHRRLPGSQLLQAFKIVIVVWQIVTQARDGCRSGVTKCLHTPGISVLFILA